MNEDEGLVPGSDRVDLVGAENLWAYRDGETKPRMIDFPEESAPKPEYRLGVDYGQDGIDGIALVELMPDGKLYFRKIARRDLAGMHFDTYVTREVHVAPALPDWAKRAGFSGIGWPEVEGAGGITVTAEKPKARPIERLLHWWLPVLAASTGVAAIGIELQRALFG